MNELELREEPEGGGPVVAASARQHPAVAVTAIATLGVLMFLPPSAIGTTILAGGVALMLRVFHSDLPSMLEQHKVRPEVVAIGSVAATLYMYDVVIDNALLPLSVDALSQPLMALATGTLVVLTAAIPAFAVSVWRFWQREMM